MADADFLRLLGRGRPSPAETLDALRVRAQASQLKAERARSHRFPHAVSHLTVRHAKAIERSVDPCLEPSRARDPPRFMIGLLLEPTTSRVPSGPRSVISPRIILQLASTRPAYRNSLASQTLRARRD